MIIWSRYGYLRRHLDFLLYLGPHFYFDKDTFLNICCLRSLFKRRSFSSSVFGVHTMRTSVFLISFVAVNLVQLEEDFMISLKLCIPLVLQIVKSIKSLPCYPRSNGLAERFVQTIKKQQTVLSLRKDKLFCLNKSWKELVWLIKSKPLLQLRSGYSQELFK